MVRKLLATTALVTLLSGAAFAQDTTQPAPAPAQPAPMESTTEAPVARADGHLASNLIGETVYNGTGDDAENIGEVNDVVIGANGNVEAVVIGVGGFLGIGEKNVALNYSEIDWAERDGDRWIVVNATKEQLEAQADFDRRAYDPAPAANATAMAPAPADTTTAGPPAATTAEATPPADTATPPADTTAEATPPADTATPPADTSADATPPADTATPPADTTAQAPAADPAAPAATDQTQTGAIDRASLKEIPSGEVRAENLVGTTVYGTNDETIGEIGDVVLSQDGKVDAILIDVGGFLGIGEKEVAVGMDNLQFMTDGDGNNYLYTTFTKEQLEAAPAYDAATWAQNRDTQRVIMQ